MARYFENARLAAPDSADWDAANWTIGLWIKTRISGLQYIVTRDDEGSNRLFYAGLNGGNAEFSLFPTPTVLATTGLFLNNNEWHHLAYRYDAATMKIFVDGVEKASGVKTSQSVGNVQLTIGSRQTATYGYVTGGLSDIAYFGRALDPWEIQELATLHASPRQVGSNDLLAWWPMTKIGTEYDISGRSNHAAVADADTIRLITDLPHSNRVPYKLYRALVPSFQDSATVLVDLQASGTDLYEQSYLDTATALLDLQASGVEYQTFQYLDAATVPLNLRVTNQPWQETFADLSKWTLTTPERFFVSKIHATHGQTSLRVNSSTMYDYNTIAGAGNIAARWEDVDSGGDPNTTYWVRYAFYLEDWALLWRNGFGSNKYLLLPAITAKGPPVNGAWGDPPVLKATSATTGTLQWGSPFYSGGANSVALTAGAWHSIRMAVKYDNVDAYGAMYLDNVLLDTKTQAWPYEDYIPRGIEMVCDLSLVQGVYWVDDLLWSPNADPGEPSKTETSPNTSTRQWVMARDKTSGLSASVDIEIDPAVSEVWVYGQIFIPTDYGLANGDTSQPFFYCENQGVSIGRISTSSVYKFSGGYPSGPIDGIDDDVFSIIKGAWNTIEAHMVANQSTWTVRLNGYETVLAINPGLIPTSITDFSFGSLKWSSDSFTWIGIDNMVYSLVGWPSEGGALADNWAFEGRNILNIANTNYPTPPRGVYFGPGGDTISLEEGNIIESPAVYNPIIRLDLQTSFTEESLIHDAATVYLDLTAFSGLTIDLATIYFDMQPLGGECYSTWSSLQLDGEADLRWSTSQELVRWSSDDNLRWSQGEVLVEGINC